MRSFLYSPGDEGGGAAPTNIPTITLADGTVITPDKIKSVKFKADDADREVDGAGLFRVASKGYAADNVLAQRSEWEKERSALRTQAEQFSKQQELIQRYTAEKDPAAAKELLTLWGYGHLADEYDAAMAQRAEQERGGGAAAAARNAPLSYADLPPYAQKAVQQALEFEKLGITNPAEELARLSKLAQVDAKSKGQAFVNSRLDNSPKLRKLLSDGDASQAIRTDVWAKIQGRVARGEALTDATAKVVQETEAIYGAVEKNVLSRFTGDPTSFGGLPTGTSGQPRLAPESEPNPEADDYQGPGGMARYFDDKIAWERSQGRLE